MSQTRLALSDTRLLEPIWSEPVERVVLPNGLTLILKADRSAGLASVQVWVKTGSQHEEGHLGGGLSHFLEHLLFKGTSRRAAREISATIQSHGGYINAYTTFDRTVYFVDLPSAHLPVAVEVLADAMFNSTLPEDEVERERSVILREIAMTRDDPENRFWEELFATAFREHPYRHPVIGYRDVFSEVKRDELVRYYRARYTPNNMVVVIVGDIEITEARRLVEEQFGGVPRVRLAPVPVIEEPPILARRERHWSADVEVTRGALAWQIPGLAHPDTPVLDLLALILGGGDSSVLWQEVRDKAGLVHTIDAHSWSPGRSGLFAVSFTCDPDKREAAVAAIERTLQHCLRRGIAAADLRKARRQLVVAEINARKTMEGQASRLGAAEVVIGELDFAPSFFSALGRVRPLDLKRTMRQYLRPERTISLSMSPRSQASAAASRGGAVAAPPDFEEILLPNGARLLLQPDPRRPKLHLRLLCLGGPEQVPANRRGAASLLATLLTKDTRRRPAAAVARLIEEVGGAFRPLAGNISLGLGLEVLAPDAARACEVLSDAVLAPAFRSATLETERAAQLAELLQDADDVVTFGRKRIRQLFFGRHPLACDAEGDLSGVRAVTGDDLRSLHRSLLVAPNVVLAVAGDFSPRTLVPRLRAFLERLPSDGGPSRRRRASALPGSPGDHLEHRPCEQAVVFLAFPGAGVLDPDFYVGEVADELFSGMASRLFERVREEKGLAYFVRSARVVGLNSGMFCFFAGTAPEQVAAVIAEMEAEIARVQDGKVETDELRRCQVRLRAAREQSLQTIGARAMQAGLNALYGLPPNDWKSYGDRIDAVSREDLARFARTHFQSSLRSQLVVKP